jgi:citronellol/citronellal dehydrogenase
VKAVCAELSARVEDLGWEPDDEDACDGAVAAMVQRHAGVHTLVNDAAAAYELSLGQRGDWRAGQQALRAALDGAWNATRAAANGAFIAAADGGKVINLAPPPSAGPGAVAAAAGLENMARTLSIEWSRYGIRVTTIAPGDTATPAQVATLVAFLASPAGDYYSGCRFALAC